MQETPILFGEPQAPFRGQALGLTPLLVSLAFNIYQAFEIFRSEIDKS